MLKITKKNMRKVLMGGLCTLSLIILATVSPLAAEPIETVQVGKGGYSLEVVGQQVYGESLHDREYELQWLPAGEGNVYVTDNMTGPVPTNDWATSALWGRMYYPVENPYSQPMYAFPMSFKASAEGFEIASPPKNIVPHSDGRITISYPHQPGFVDLVLGSSNFSPPDARVDKVTDWSYDILMADGSKSIKATIAHGSPYAYFEFSNTNPKLTNKRMTLMEVVSGNENTNALMIRIEDNKEGDWNYYGLYAPDGTTWIYEPGERIGSIEAVLPNGREYFTVALLPNGEEETFQLYKDYAYNFISDTKVDWYYDESDSQVNTEFSIETENKAESQATGTLIGLYPHQWRNMKRVNSAYTYETLRGTMKVIKGSRFETQLDYFGVVPWLPELKNTDEAYLQRYLDEYAERTQDNTFPYLDNFEGREDTYWLGKSLGKLYNLIPLAEQVGDHTLKEEMLNTLKAVLESWFTPVEYGNDGKLIEDRYFYYNEDVGTLIGYPSGFGSDTELNDHHFHYGYWIQTAAQIALHDPEWAELYNWGGMVEELIMDIANPDRTSDRYPFLRNFDPYEGHSWASGHQLFNDGNNQESSSEAINAWTGLILWGEATGNQEIRDLGIYLYTTEVESVNNYWFDLYGDVLEPEYIYADANAHDYVDGKEKKHVQTSMVWGGKYDFGCWWTAEPIQIHGINLLPINGGSLYLGKDAEYVKANYELTYEQQENYKGSDKSHNGARWQDILVEYLALSDPELALSKWDDEIDDGVEYGETKAHTYHWMKSLDTYGRPNFNVYGDTPLSHVFTKDGENTYVAYNTGSDVLNVTFSDGVVLEAEPHRLSILSEVVDQNPDDPDPNPDDPNPDDPDPNPDPDNPDGDDNQTDQPYGVIEIDEASIKIFFTSETDIEWVDVHYTINNGPQMNIRMIENAENWEHVINNVDRRDIVEYAFTYFDGLGHDTDLYLYIRE